MLKDLKGKNIIRIESGINFSFNLISSIFAMNRQKKSCKCLGKKLLQKWPGFAMMPILIDTKFLL